MVRHRLAGALALGFFVFVCAGAAVAAQAILELDLSTPSDESREASEGWYSFDPGIGWSLGIFTRDLRESTNRFGVFLRRSGIEATYFHRDVNRFEYDYQTLSVQAGYERRLLALSWSTLAVGLATGPTWVSVSNDVHDSFGFDLPELAWQIAPHVLALVPIREEIVLVARGRWVIYTGADDILFPFESGPVASVGLAFGKSGR